MSHSDIFGAAILAIVAITPIALAAVANTDWYEHRLALRKLRYEAELRAHQRALRESEDR